MNGNLIAAAVLFGPAAVACPAAAVAWWRHRGEHEAALAELAAVRVEPSPPDGGVPEPVPGPAAEPLAEVIPFPARRAA